MTSLIVSVLLSQAASAAPCAPAGHNICYGTTNVTCVLSPYGNETAGAWLQISEDPNSAGFLFTGTDALGNAFDCADTTLPTNITVTGTGLADAIDAQLVTTRLFSLFIVHGEGGDDTITAPYAADVPSRIWGDAGADVILGSAGDDAIYCGHGDDYVDAGGGDDWVQGDEENDTIYGDDGDDYVDGGAGADTISGDRDDDILLGGNGPDLLAGGTGDDTLNGGLGLDSLCGNEDDDTLIGADGSDHLYGGTGVDTEEGDADTDYCTAVDLPASCDHVWLTATNVCGAN